VVWKIVRFIETESRRVITRDWEWGLVAQRVESFSYERGGSLRDLPYHTMSTVDNS
jgi:hypothetical protein